MKRVKSIDITIIITIIIMGRGNERGGGRASSGGRGSRRQFKPAATTTPTVEKLSTAKPELKDHIFYVNKPDQAHNFVESRKKLLNYLGEELKDGCVMMKALEAEKDFSETEPLPVEGERLQWQSSVGC